MCIRDRVDENGGKLQICHVPHPDGTRHVVTTRGHVVRGVAPLELLDARRRSLGVDGLKARVLEAFDILLGELWDLDDFAAL